MGKRRIKGIKIRPVLRKITRAIPIGSRLVCADNTGAKVLELIGVNVYKGVRRRMPAACVGDLVTCTVKKGSPEWKGKVVKAIIIRQKKEYKRANGMRVKFEDNAAILVDDDGDPRGTEIKGPVAKEAVKKWTTISKIASMIM